MKKKIIIWHFPTWYPHRNNPNLGSFVKKQILSAATFSQNVVFLVIEDESITEEFEVSVSKSENLLEIFITIHPSNSRFEKLRKKKKAFQLAINQEVLKNLEPDFVHAHTLSFASFMAKKIAHKYGVKWFLSEHWSGFLPASGKFESMPTYIKKIWKYHANQADGIICVSQTLKKAMKGCGLKNDNYRIIPNVIEVDDVFFSNLKENDSHQEKFVFLNVSDMVDKIKNIKDIIHSFNAVWSRYPFVELWLVGDGVDSKKLKKIAKNSPATKNIKFFGSLLAKEVISIFSQIDVTVINSRYETFSMVAAESIFAGKPVIVTKCGGPEEFITESQGVLVGIDDREALQEAMRKMIFEAKEYESLALHLYMKNLFSKEKIADKFKELYRQ